MSVFRTRPIRVFALLVGVAFLAVGVLGFLPGSTTRYEELALAGPDSGALLFGLFRVSVLHNVLHLVFGVAGVAAFWSTALARLFLVVGGGAYVLLAVYGAGVGVDSPANVIPVNNADDWLHLGLGLGMIVLGFAGTAVERARGDYPRRD
ncbi:DUF4383 domain-containing protein [Amycolatopsis aidingensis]|uniref:DUF4383 domain-containing protein n=1 Tax=Amycolatopsis aidingensis TaxID=2842453 RepID=UPI001E59753C|nr:DUF4383 domain-containing protein [Amycolatopsis aidingensis]